MTDDTNTNTGTMVTRRQAVLISVLAGSGGVVALSSSGEPVLADVTGDLVGENKLEFASAGDVALTLSVDELDVDITWTEEPASSVDVTFELEAQFENDGYKQLVSETVAVGPDSTETPFETTGDINIVDKLGLETSDFEPK